MLVIKSKETERQFSGTHSCARYTKVIANAINIVLGNSYGQFKNGPVRFEALDPSETVAWKLSSDIPKYPDGHDLTNFCGVT